MEFWGGREFLNSIFHLLIFERQLVVPFYSLLLSHPLFLLPYFSFTLGAINDMFPSLFPLSFHIIHIFSLYFSYLSSLLFLSLTLFLTTLANSLSLYLIKLSFSRSLCCENTKVFVLREQKRALTFGVPLFVALFCCPGSKRDGINERKGKTCLAIPSEAPRIVGGAVE